MDGPVLRILGGRLLINGIAKQVEYAAQALVTDRNLDRLTGVDSIRTADKAVCGGHRNAADHIVTDMLGNLNDQLFSVVLQLDSVEQGGQFTVLESDVQYRSHDLHYLSDVFFWHSTHSFSGLFVSFPRQHQPRSR